MTTRRAPGAGRKPSPPDAKYVKRQISLPPALDAKIALLSGFGSYSGTVRFLLETHPVILEMRIEREWNEEVL